MNTLEERVNSSPHLSRLPADLTRAVPLQRPDLPTSCTPLTVCAVGLFVNLLYINALVATAVAVTERYPDLTQQK